MQFKVKTKISCSKLRRGEKFMNSPGVGKIALWHCGKLCRALLRVAKGIFLSSLIRSMSKQKIISETREMKGFLQLLFKERNTGRNWTEQERNQIKRYLKRLSVSIPFLIVFIVPGGSILIPILAAFLDRRKTKRLQASRNAINRPYSRTIGGNYG